jgi:two-component system, response regulator PdtaR
MESESASPHHSALTPPAVLIVDQDFMSRWKTADYLRERGYFIIEATDASDAMALIASGTRVDIVIFDLSSRDASDTRSLAEWLDQHHPELSRLMTSKSAVEAPLSAPGRSHRVVVESYELAQLAAHLESLLKAP